MDQQVAVAPKRWLVRLNMVLTVLGLGLAAWCVVSVLNAPFGGMRAPSYLIICVFGWIGCNRGFALWQQFTQQRILRFILRIAKWILPFLVPVLVVRAAETNVQSRQIEIVARDLAPVIAFADRQTPGSFVPVQAPAPRFPTAVHYQETVGSYALWLLAPGVDLEGYTLSYDSQTRLWLRRHNNRPNAEHLIDGRCVLKYGAWQCIDTQLPAAPRIAD